MTMALEMPTDHCRYQETTELLNLPFLRMATSPPADIIGLLRRIRNRMFMGMGASSSPSFSSVSLPRITVRIPTKVKNIIIMSYLLITIFNMKKARRKTNTGAMLMTIEIIVSGMYLVTEY